MLDPDYLEDVTLESIMENMETEDPLDLKPLSAEEAFDKFLAWQGILGYTGMLIKALNSCRAAELRAELRELVEKSRSYTITEAAARQLLFERGACGDPEILELMYRTRLPAGQFMLCLTEFVR